MKSPFLFLDRCWGFVLRGSLICWAAGTAVADPLFKNSVVSNDIDFIRSDDPSTAFEVVAGGRGRKEMPDKRNDELFMDQVFAFRIAYEDGSKVALWAAPTLGEEEATRYATRVGEALGKLPGALRRRLSHVVLHDGDETAFAEEEGAFFVLYSDNVERRLTTHDLEETVFHETIHATLEAEHAKCDAWKSAQQRDGDFITDYAAEHPEKEDLPESALFAYTLTVFPGRLPEDVEKAVRETMPNRLQYLVDLFTALREER